jgi:hypothetical protein
MDDKWRFFKAGAGTIALALLGSALWDFLIKPGLTGTWSNVLAFLTFGSKTIRDSVYAFAALDPSSLPALLLIVGACMIGAMVFGLIAGAYVGEAAARMLDIGRGKGPVSPSRSTSAESFALATPWWVRIPGSRPCHLLNRFNPGE